MTKYTYLFHVVHNLNQHVRRIYKLDYEIKDHRHISEIEKRIAVASDVNEEKVSIVSYQLMNIEKDPVEKESDPVIPLL